MSLDRRRHAWAGKWRWFAALSLLLVLVLGSTATYLVVHSYSDSETEGVASALYGYTHLRSELIALQLLMKPSKRAQFPWFRQCKMQ
jgi:hypothetical protein